MSKKFINNYDEDSIGRYFKEVRPSKILTPDEEVILTNRIQSGDTDAIEELTFANLKFVISIAKEYQNQGLSLNDLINEGNYGLIKAASRFDASRGFRFISYAVWWIRQSILQSLNDNSRMVRLPANVIQKLNKIRKEIEKFGFEQEREPVIGEVLNEDSNEDEITAIYTPKVTSLNNIISEDGTELSELIPDLSDEPTSIYVIDNQVKEELNKVLGKLNNRERDIIENYFGINIDSEPLTLEDIGSKYSLTKERVRQIKEKAIRKLKHNSGGLFELIKD